MPSGTAISIDREMPTTARYTVAGMPCSSSTVTGRRVTSDLPKSSCTARYSHLPYRTIDGLIEAVLLLENEPHLGIVDALIADQRVDDVAGQHFDEGEDHDRQHQQDRYEMDQTSDDVGKHRCSSGRGGCRDCRGQLSIQVVRSPPPAYWNGPVNAGL